MSSTRSAYRVLVYIAYGYFILLSLAWLVASSRAGGINFTALIAFLLFSVQAYLKNRYGHLLLGIVTLAMSIFMTLQSLSFAGSGGFDGFAKLLLSMSVVSVVLSLILLFGYIKLAPQQD